MLKMIHRLWIKIKEAGTKYMFWQVHQLLFRTAFAEKCSFAVLLFPRHNAGFCPFFSSICLLVMLKNQIKLHGDIMWLLTKQDNSCICIISANMENQILD